MNIAGLFRNKAFIVLTLATVVVLVVGGMPATLSAAALQPPSEESYKVGHGDEWSGKVRFRSGTGDGASFVTSWAREGASEQITVQGSVSYEHSGYCIRLGNQCALEAYKYVISTNTGDGKWVEQRVDGPHVLNRDVPRAREGGLTLDSFTTTLTGPMVGVMKADLWIKVNTDCNRLGVCKKDWVIAAQDGARLLDGSGLVDVKPGQSNLVEEGQRVDFSISSGHGGPWMVIVRDGDGAPVCLSDAKFSGTVRATRNACDTTWTGRLIGATFGFTVPQGAYRTDGRNEWQVVLFNSVTQQSAVSTFIIDQKKFAPEPPKVVEPQQNVKVGQVIELPATSRANPSTGLAIKEFQFDAWCGRPMPADGSESWLVRDERVEATPTQDAYTAVLQVRLDRDCDVVTYRAVAYDTSGRPSGSILSEDDRQVLIEAGIPDANGRSQGVLEVEGHHSTHGYATPTDSSGPPVWLLWLLLVALGGFVIWYVVPLAPPLKAAIIAGGAIVVLLFTMGGS